MLAEPSLLRWRRYLLFSVRGMLVLVISAGLGMGCLVRTRRIQREAAAAIRTAGGSVQYEWERYTRFDIPPETPRTPGWIADLIGFDYFDRIVMVRIDHGAADSVMEHVGRLTALDELYLSYTKVTDAGIATIIGLTRGVERRRGESGAGFAMLVDDRLGRKCQPSLFLVLEIP